MYNKYNNEGNAFTIASRGEYAGFINYLLKKFWAGGLCYPYCSVDEKKIKTKYIYYYLKNTEKYIKDKLVIRGGIPALNKVDVENLKIPVPPLEVQNQIICILDNFTLFSTELSEKILAELKARQNQYEYYKDELYTFKNKNIEYKKLGSIAQISRGGNFQKKDFIGEGMPCIHYGQIYTQYGSSATKTLTFINENVFNKSKKAQRNDIIMAVTSENIEDVCKCVVWLGKEKIAVSGHTAIIHHNINPQYLAYYFSTSHFFKQKKKLAHGTKVIEVTPSTLNDILIPLPSSEEQERIAKILEKFDRLCNNISESLSAEIKANKKQYEYYRNRLLSFKEMQSK